MNIEQAHDYLRRHRPEIIHLSGKTSTGKSTFASQLSKEFGYEIIELDQLVHTAVINRYNLTDEGQAFVEVYKNQDRLELIDSFVTAAKEKVAILEAEGHPVIIDGAVANPHTLKRLLGELSNSVIVYLHPLNLDNYRRNLLSRFATATADSNAGLPAQFWKMIDKVEFGRFCKSGIVTSGIQDAVAQYALDSQSESVKRLKIFRHTFDNILVVDI